MYLISLGVLSEKTIWIKPTSSGLFTWNSTQKYPGQTCPFCEHLHRQYSLPEVDCTTSRWFWWTREFLQRHKIQSWAGLESCKLSYWLFLRVQEAREASTEGNCFGGKIARPPRCCWWNYFFSCRYLLSKITQLWQKIVARELAPLPSLLGTGALPRCV